MDRDAFKDCRTMRNNGMLGTRLGLGCMIAQIPRAELPHLFVKAGILFDDVTVTVLLRTA